MLALLVAGLACARNSSSDSAVGAARDSSTTATADSASNQTETGVSHSRGSSTLGNGVTKTRPDQGQPVTAKGDTLDSGVDSATQAR